MKKRGKIMRDPTVGPGLVMVQGQQLSFALEGVWKSDALPRPGLVVDVELDAAGKISAMTAVAEGQLAKEQAEAAIALAREKGQALATGLVARFGIARLAATALLILGWFILSTITLDASFLGTLKFTFWQVLGFLNAGSPLEALAGGRGGASAGLYGVVAVLCLAGPFLGHFWQDRRAPLAGALPVVFMLGVAVIVNYSIGQAVGSGNSLGGEYGETVAEMQRQARAEAMKAVSLGAGAYLSLLSGLYLAAKGIKDWLVGRASGTAAVPADR